MGKGDLKETETQRLCRYVNSMEKIDDAYNMDFGESDERSSDDVDYSHLVSERHRLIP